MGASGRGHPRLLLVMVGVLAFFVVPAVGAGSAAAVTPSAVTLTANRTVASTGQTAGLTATANQIVNGGNLYLQVFDVTSGARVCIDSYVTSTSCTVPWRAQPHTYLAYVAQPGLDDPPPDIQAESEPLTVEPRTGVASVYYAIHQWSSSTDPSHTTYDITAAGQGLAAGSGPCLTAACSWDLTVTYIDAQSVQQVLTLDGGLVAAGQDSFTADRTGTLDMHGASGAFLTLTLTPAGSTSPALGAGGTLAGALSSEIIDGIDIGAAFGQITANYASGLSVDPCSNLLFVPGTRVAPTSTSDEYNQCELATGGGTTRLTLQQLMNLVRTYGPQIANILAGTPTTSQTPTTPAPLSLDIHLDQPSIDRVAEVMIGQSTGKMDNRPQAKIAARACLEALARLRGALPSQPTASCTGMPVFFPGGDNHATTANDYDGIYLGNNTLDQQPRYDHLPLTYETKRNRFSGSWKRTTNPCPQSTILFPCDEYPFLSAQQAATDGTALALVPRSQNSSEGELLSAFYRRCGITGVRGAPFLLIPLVGPSAPPTMYTCGG